MIIEISGMFFGEYHEHKVVEKKIEKEMTIEEAIADLGLRDLEYAVYILNDRFKFEKTLVKYEERMIIVPVFTGG